MTARRWGRRLAIGLAVTVLLLLALVAGALLLVDTADLRRTVAEQVEARTGRELRIDGELGISLFPWLGFELGPTRLANAGGFDRGPFLVLERAELRVRLLPLLRREVAVDRVVLHGLRLNLARDAAGRGNWEDLLPEASAAPATASGSDATDATQGGGLAASTVRIEGIELRDAALHWQDAASGQSLAVRDLALETGALAPGVSTPVRLRLRLEPSGGPSLALALQTEASFEPATQTLRLAALAADLVARDERLPDGELQLGLAGDLTADLAATRARLEPLELAAGESRATGSLQLRLADLPEARLQLAVDTLDLDPLLPPPAPDAGSGAAGEGAVGPAADPVASLPLAALRGLRAQAAIEVGRLRARGLDAEHVALRARLDDGLLTLERLGANVAGGRLQLGGRLDGRADTAAVSLRVGIAGLRSEPLLRALGGAAPVSGRLDAAVELDTAGATLDQWIGALVGSVTGTFADGAIEGINLAQRIRIASARLRGEAVEAAADVRRTDFSRLHFTASVQDGVLRSDTLDLRAPLLRVGGAGTLDLGRREVDYVARILVTGTLEGQGGAEFERLRGLEIPLRIRGPLTAPELELALESALEARAKAQREQLRREVQAAEERARRELEQAAEQEQRELRRRQEEAERKVRDRLEDKLKGLFD